MRLPFLQVESDLLAHGIGSVAALLGCSEVEALGHVAFLRAWAVSRGPDDAPPDGWVPGTNAARLVAAGARWRGEPAVLIGALSDPAVGLVECTPDGIRVLGMSPYAEAWAKNAKARERLRKFRERNANETRTSGDVSGQTQTQTQTQITSSSGDPSPEADDDTAGRQTSATAPASPVAQRNALPPTPTSPQLDLVPPEPTQAATQSPAPNKPRTRQQRVFDAAHDLYSSIQDSRRTRCADVGEVYVDDGWTKGQVLKVLGPLAGDPEERADDETTPEQDLFSAAWVKYLADPEGQKKTPAWSLDYFISGKVLAKYKTHAAREGAA
jgi:hypothetical protein